MMSTRPRRSRLSVGALLVIVVFAIIPALARAYDRQPTTDHTPRFKFSKSVDGFCQKYSPARPAAVAQPAPLQPPSHGEHVADAGVPLTDSLALAGRHGLRAPPARPRSNLS